MSRSKNQNPRRAKARRARHAPHSKLSLFEAFTRWFQQAKPEFKVGGGATDEIDREIVSQPMLLIAPQSEKIAYLERRLREILQSKFLEFLRGNPIPGAKISIGERGRDVQFICPIGKTSGHNQYGRLLLLKVPESLISRLYIERAEYIIDKSVWNEMLIEGMAPAQIVKTIEGVRSLGEPGKPDSPLTPERSEIQVLLGQHMARYAEDASDLKRFYDHHKNDPKKVETVVLEPSRKVIGYRLYPEAIPQITEKGDEKPLRGRAADDFKNRIIRWSGEDLALPYVVETKNGHNKRVIVRGHKMIHDYSFANNKPMMIQVSNYLVDPDWNYKNSPRLVPNNLRAVFDRYRLHPEGKRQITDAHRTAYLWMFYAQEPYMEPRKVADLLEWWQIPEYGDDPGKRWEKFNDILRFLIITGIALEAKRMPDCSRPKEIAFVVNPAEAPHVGLPAESVSR